MSKDMGASRPAKSDQELLKRLERLDELGEAQSSEENAEGDAIEDQLFERGWRFTPFGWKKP